jgi:hypothetical protein
MFATSVGLIMRGFEFLDIYKKEFNAGSKEQFTAPKSAVVPPKKEMEEDIQEQAEAMTETAPEEERIPLSEKIKSILSRMFEVEDQPIK